MTLESINTEELQAELKQRTPKQGRTPCPFCRGWGMYFTGKINDIREVTCPACDGRGKVTKEEAEQIKREWPEWMMM